MPALRKPFPDRWWYCSPRNRSRPWWFDLMRTTDEYCNPTIYIGLPAVGAWVIRYKRGPIRTEACDKCQADDGPWCANCQSCHRGPRCHDWLSCGHPIPNPVRSGDCPVCGGYYCPTCEPEPKESCPFKEKP